MRLFHGFILTAILLVSSAGWETDFEKASERAKSEHKYILLSFSGSDWCIPCIRLHKDIFESETFTRFASEKLVLVNADFPRLRKNQLSKEQQQKNESLADTYNPKGIFPYTLLLDESGKVVRSWEGYPGQGATGFTDQLKTLVNAGN